MTRLHEAQGNLLFVHEYAGQPNIHLIIAPVHGNRIGIDQNDKDNYWSSWRILELEVRQQNGSILVMVFSGGFAALRSPHWRAKVDHRTRAYTARGISAFSIVR